MGRVSVVLPTYAGDDPDALEAAVESVVSQTRPPEEFLIVRDGPVPEATASVLERYREAYPFVEVVAFEENRGRALARKVGVERATGDLVAMMDADDLSVPTRLERQVRFLEDEPDVDVVGGQLLEIDPETGEGLWVRSLPTDHEEIRELARTRSPVSQSTVTFRREAALEAGNYRDVARMEDYGLWVRMLADGARFANLPEVLVKARTGAAMYERRGGLEYAREEVRLQREFRDLGFVSLPRAVANVVTRVSVRFVPNAVRAAVYERLFRTDPPAATAGIETAETAGETDAPEATDGTDAPEYRADGRSGER